MDPLLPLSENTNGNQWIGCSTTSASPGKPGSGTGQYGTENTRSAGDEPEPAGSVWRAGAGQLLLPCSMFIACEPVEKPVRLGWFELLVNISQDSSDSDQHGRSREWNKTPKEKQSNSNKQQEWRRCGAHEMFMRSRAHQRKNVHLQFKLLFYSLTGERAQCFFLLCCLYPVVRYAPDLSKTSPKKYHSKQHSLR